MRRRGIHESSDHQRREKERTGRYVISQTGRPAILAKDAYASAFRIVQNCIKKKSGRTGRKMASSPAATGTFITFNPFFQISSICFYHDFPTPR
ncbi:hypothetical protein BURPS305_3590 [Burkholderia pseudomallei 305]|nr:hypothetical protein BURPS305_3590 [Burkholderia pseudomallei 305]